MTLREAALALILAGVAQAGATQGGTLPVGVGGAIRMCVLDPTVFDGPQDSVFVPATTVLSTDRTFQGDPADGATWRLQNPGSSDGASAAAQLETEEPASLTSSRPCALVHVAAVNTSAQAGPVVRVATHLAFSPNTVLSYVSPPIGSHHDMDQVIDNLDVVAAVVEDVSAIVQRPELGLDPDELRADCLATAKALARRVHGRVEQPTESTISLDAGGPALSVVCPLGPPPSTSLSFEWLGNAAPPGRDLTVALEAASALVGISSRDLARAAQSCIGAALRPTSDEEGTIFIKGANVECQAYKRDGGGGSLNFYRRFGPFQIVP